MFDIPIHLNISKNMCSTSNKCLKVFHRHWVIFGNLWKSSAIFDNVWKGLGGCWMCFKMFGWYSLILEGFRWFSELLVKHPTIFSNLALYLLQMEERKAYYATPSLWPILWSQGKSLATLLCLTKHSVILGLGLENVCIAFRNVHKNIRLS